MSEKKGKGGRPKGSVSERANAQLRAVRTAAKMQFGSVSDDPEIMAYLRLREEDIKAFLGLRERLEKELQDRRAETMRRSDASRAKEEVISDEVTAKLERKIEKWLRETLARVEKLPGSAVGV